MFFLLHKQSFSSFSCTQLNSNKKKNAIFGFSCSLLNKKKIQKRKKWSTFDKIILLCVTRGVAQAINFDNGYLEHNGDY